VLDVCSYRPNSTWTGDLSIDQELQARVLKIERFGAWVDVGAEIPALLHIKEISESQFTEYVSDVLSVNDSLPVFVKYADSDNKKLSVRGFRYESFLF